MLKYFYYGVCASRWDVLLRLDLSFYMAFVERKKMFPIGGQSQFCICFLIIE